jgi:hypothetical protein
VGAARIAGGWLVDHFAAARVGIGAYACSLAGVPAELTCVKRSTCVTDEDLALELQAHEQEEKAHQPVVDPVVQRQLEPRAAAGRKSERLLREQMHGFGAEDYSECQRNDGRGDENDPARRRAAKELLERGKDATEERFKRVGFVLHYVSSACLSRLDQSDAGRLCMSRCRLPETRLDSHRGKTLLHHRTVF